MKKDQPEAEEVVMKVYLHKILVEKNVFSLGGFPLVDREGAILRRWGTKLRRF